MNLFSFSGLLIVFSYTLMAGVVYFTTHTGRLNRLWALFSLAVSVWGFGVLLIGLTHDPDVSMVWWRYTLLGVIFIPALFYHFVIALGNLHCPTILFAIYAAAAAFVLADTTPFFISELRPMFGHVYYIGSPTPLFLCFITYYIGVLFFAHLELWNALAHTSQPAKRRHRQWFLAGTSLSFLGSLTCFLPVFGIDIMPYGNFAIALFPCFMSYAFLRYRLINVNLALARGAMFLLLYAVVIWVPFFVGHTYQDLWQAALGSWWWVAPVILMGLLASASPVWFLLVLRRMEQRMWQDQRRYHRTLVAASSGMIRVKDIQRLCRLIVHVVNRTVELTNTSLFLYDLPEQRYFLRASRYPSYMPHDLGVEQHEALVELLKEEKDILVIDELHEEMIDRQSSARSRWVASIYLWMHQLELRLIVPSFSNDRLLAFLALGAKRNGEPYTTDDVAVFSGLANQGALAIENAMFFEELRNNEAYMVQSEKLASLGQLASGMAHEIHNPLTIISGESQLYLERFKGQDPKVDSLLFSIIEECKRAADITRRILRFAKPAPPEVAPVDLKIAVEESLTLAGYQVKLDRVERLVTIPDDLPKVRSNQNQLQEVLLNLILNACQAMGESGGKLMLSADANGGTYVEMKVEDTGPGIPANVLRKVFDPFYTTKSTGTGLGLFVSQRIVKSHGGTIELESQEGRGARFTIRLPVWKD